MPEKSVQNRDEIAPRQLRDMIAQAFNLVGIDLLCFDLQIDAEDIAGSTHTSKVVSLIRYCQQHGRLNDLLQYCRDNRPEFAWPSLTVSQAASAPPPLSEIPDPLTGLSFTFDEINHTVVRLRQAHQVYRSAQLPLPVLLPLLDELFEAQTFRHEQLRSCLAQAWGSRLHYICQVHRILRAYLGNVRDLGTAEQKTLYNQLLQAIARYAMTVSTFLFEQVVNEGEVLSYVGTETFYDHLPKMLAPFEQGPEGLLIPDPINKPIQDACDAANERMSQLVQTAGSL